MVYDPQKHHRRSIRLKDYDYTRAGAYFVTACVQRHACLFGDVVDGDVQLNALGQIVADEWVRTEAIRTEVILDVYVVIRTIFMGLL